MVDLHISIADGGIMRSIEDIAKTALAVAPLLYKGFRFLQKNRRTKSRRETPPPPPEDKPEPAVD